MKRIRRIYTADLKRIFSNRGAMVIVLGLCILPSLYAWFYLKSSRDPYGNTRGIKVAVVNNDIGAVFKEEFVNIGAEVIKELKTDQNIGWVFVDENIANQGTKLGKYYASIVIESGFSEKMITLLDEFPQHPEIRYTVNEKLNAIAPKITSKGATTIKENIQKSFIDTVNRILMEKLNLVGFDLQASKTSVYGLIDFVHDARESLDAVDEKINKILEISYRSRYQLEEAYGKLPTLKSDINQGKEALYQSRTLAEQSLKLLDTVPDQIQTHKTAIQDIARSIDSEFSAILSYADQKNQHLENDLNQITSKLTNLENELWRQAQKITQRRDMIDHLLPHTPLTAPFNKLLQKLNLLRQKSISIRSTLSPLSQDAQKVINFSKDTQTAIQGIRQDLRTSLDDLHDDYETNIEPALRQVLNHTQDLSTSGIEKLDRLENKLPDLQRNLEEGARIINTETEKVRSFQEKLPKLQKDVKTIDQHLQKLKASWKLENFIEVATLDPNRFSEFIAEPVKLVENKFFSIPNYGSAMSPFFTTLAIRVGSLLNISLFTTKIREKTFYHCKHYQKYLGKRLLFLSIALIQGIIIALGDMFLLNAYVANKGAFIGITLRAAMVFSMIIYTTVATFWNAGKAIVIVFLVLQLSWAGGTFPIELSGSFFQAINPFLPFTYAIIAMREAVGGVLREIYLPNMTILLSFFGIFLCIGIFIKPLIAPLIARFEHKFSTSELWEH